MAEIKSSLELALERTKKMIISEKEKEEIRQKEIVEKAKALFHRYREGHVPLHDLQKEIQKMDQKTSNAVRELLLSQWIEVLSLKDEDERLMKGIEWLKDGLIPEIVERYHQLSSQYREEKEKARNNLRARLEETLRKEGIAGSAVEPNVEASPLWKEAVQKLDRLYGEKLEEIKKQLRTL